jgi:hypothetical protein
MVPGARRRDQGQGHPYRNTTIFTRFYIFLTFAEYFNSFIFSVFNGFYLKFCLPAGLTPDIVRMAHRVIPGGFWERL